MLENWVFPPAWLLMTAELAVLALKNTVCPLALLVILVIPAVFALKMSKVLLLTTAPTIEPTALASPS